MDQSVSPSGKELLLRALQDSGIAVLRQEENKVFVENDYCVEVEGKNLFKLSQEGYIIAPYDNLNELCQMIKMG